LAQVWCCPSAWYRTRVFCALLSDRTRPFTMQLIIKNTNLCVLDVDASSPKLARSQSDGSLHVRSLCEVGPIYCSSSQGSLITHSFSTINSVCDSVKMNFMQDVLTHPYKSPCQGSLTTLGLSRIDAGFPSDRMTPMPLHDETPPYRSTTKDSLGANSTISTVCNSDEKSSMPDDKEQHDEPTNEVEFGGTWSVGAELHHIDECKPCAWFWKPSGCDQGASCRFCHLCKEGDSKAKKKRKPSAYRKLEWRARRGHSTGLIQGTTSLESGLMDGTAQCQPSMSISNKALNKALRQLAAAQVNQEQGYAEDNDDTVEGASGQRWSVPPLVKHAKPQKRWTSQRRSSCLASGIMRV